jgi:hypothetical protein
VLDRALCPTRVARDEARSAAKLTNEAGTIVLDGRALVWTEPL